MIRKIIKDKRGGLIAYLFWITLGIIFGVFLASFLLKGFMCG